MKVVELFQGEFGLLPMTQFRGLNGSVLYYYVFAGRSVIVEEYAEGGWCEYISGASIKVDETIKTLKALQCQNDT